MGLYPELIFEGIYPEAYTRGLIAGGLYLGAYI